MKHTYPKLKGSNIFLPAITKVHCSGIAIKLNTHTHAQIMTPTGRYWLLMLFAFLELTPGGHMVTSRMDIALLLQWNQAKHCVQMLSPTLDINNTDHSTEILFAEIYEHITTTIAVSTLFVSSIDRLANHDAASASGLAQIISSSGNALRVCNIYMMFATKASDLATVFIDSNGMRFAPHTVIFVLSAYEPTAWTDDQLHYIDEQALLVFWIQMGRWTESTEDSPAIMWIVSSINDFRSIAVSSATEVYHFMNAHRTAVLMHDNGSGPRDPLRISAINCPPYVKLTRRGNEM